MNSRDVDFFYKRPVKRPDCVMSLAYDLVSVNILEFVYDKYLFIFHIS